MKQLNSDFQIDDAEEMNLMTGRKKYEDPAPVDDSQPGLFITLCLTTAILLAIAFGIWAGNAIYF